VSDTFAEYNPVALVLRDSNHKAALKNTQPPHVIADLIRNPETLALHGLNHKTGMKDIQPSHVNADLFKEPESHTLHGLRVEPAMTYGGVFKSLTFFKGLRLALSSLFRQSLFSTPKQEHGIHTPSPSLRPPSHVFRVKQRKRGFTGSRTSSCRMSDTFAEYNPAILVLNGFNHKATVKDIPFPSIFFGFFFHFRINSKIILGGILYA